jgi:tetratricopeptide (TPR) repeat protein
MTIVVLLALFAAGPQTEPGRAGGQPGSPPAPTQSANQIAEAYRQFLLALRLEGEKDLDGAVAAYERAMASDPQAADVPAALADLHMRSGKFPEAIAAATRALKIEQDNRDAHRVLGMIYASVATGTAPRTPAARQAQQESIERAIRHLEQAAVHATGPTQADMSLRDTLARIYLVAERYESAIPLLIDLIRRDPGRTDLARLLADAYGSSGRVDEAIRWLEELVSGNPQLYSTLGDYYARTQRWSDAAGAYEQALRGSPKGFDVRVRYATMLLNVGGAANETRARDVLREAVAIRVTESALYLLSQAERASGDFTAAEATARKLIAQNAANPRGYSALAEALIARRRYTEIIEALVPAAAKFRSSPEPAVSLGLLLPRLGFAYQQVGRHNEAIAIFEELRALSPKDTSITGDLIEAHLSAKHYQTAVDVARSARVERPDDVWLATLEARALHLSGKADEGIAVLAELVARRGNDPQAHMALANVYSDTSRGTDAVRVLREAQSKFPSEMAIVFQLGAVYERHKQFTDAETAFRQVIDRDPKHAPALNYLGYMLAERGERLSESVELIKRALEIEPENGAYLDSLGWAYFKDGRLDLAEVNLKLAAEQLTTNSVIQDHYGDLLFKLERYQEAVDAWKQALAGDGESIDRGDIDRKIRTAQQRLNRR